MNPRTLLVTGCSRGIGLAVTRRLLDEGHAVIGVSRQHPDVGDTGFIHVRLDLSDLQRLPEQLAEIAKSHPQIDGLVLNAGMGRFGALEQFSRNLSELDEAQLAAARRQADRTYDLESLVLSSAEARDVVIRDIYCHDSQQGMRRFRRQCL